MRQARPRPIPDDNDNYWKAVYESRPLGGRSWQASADAKMPLILSSGAYLLIRDKCVIFARNCKIAKSFQCNMQYIQCNSAFLDHKAWFFIAFCFKKHFLGQKRSKRDKIANVKA